MIRMKCCTSLLLMLAGMMNGMAGVAEDTPLFEQQLKNADPARLAMEARRRGDPQRGAIVFHRSPAGCAQCHQSGEAASPLGPDLAKLGSDTTDLHVIEALLYPSKSIRKGYETLTVLTNGGNVYSGLLARQTDDEWILRDATNLETEIRIVKDEIDSHKLGQKSMMPDGLLNTLRSQRDFFDLVSYLLEIVAGGTEREAALKPSPEQLVTIDDTTNLDHARILSGMRERDFEAGESIYQGLCISCHGADGNTPSLPTARAFGTQPLKFGADPYRMFMTLSRGNGLMSPVSHLSPQERYQVVHYIRERFMKGSNPVYGATSDEYLASLPKGKELGGLKLTEERDFGPALASQLGRDVNSALTIKLGSVTVSYNLHSLGLAGAWRGGFLNLDQTQHMRGRGEGYPQPAGETLVGLGGWQWGHDGALDYPQDGLLPRGPLPSKWLDYKGHYLHEDKTILHYFIDGREVLELPQEQPGTSGVRHTLRIGPGKELVLSTAIGTNSNRTVDGIVSAGQGPPVATEGTAVGTIAVSGQFNDKRLEGFTASTVSGDSQGMTWSVDDRHRLVLRIPADTNSRLIAIITTVDAGQPALDHLRVLNMSIDDPGTFTRGGKHRWPQIIGTVGYPSLASEAYVVDAITLPESTPWNTWFRTTAIDFFPDGRMVVTTHGGDVWIVSGLDDELLKINWKRFAGGLYEPFGVKVVHDEIYVTCKDRLTRLNDVNHDGEADFYESFSADTDVSSFFHAFNFDLQTDSLGNFYYAKAGQYTNYALPGAVIKVSPDGKSQEVLCTGFRTPNGMGILPDDRLTVSDNQGNWIPASKISLVKKDGFYGYVQTHASKNQWSPDGGRIDHTKVVPPVTFDQPMIWMPQDLDNSSGGQLWVDDPRWGPLSGRLLHTSFGKGWLNYLMMQDVDGVTQAAMIKMPHDFITGIMRARVNPSDGQVYVTGLNGWNEGGRRGLADKGIERVRYTGRPHRMVSDCQVESAGLRLEFNFPVDPTTASDIGSYVGKQWNYHWKPSYGSEMYHPKTGQVGTETVAIDSIQVSADRKTVFLTVRNLQPVDQLHLQLNLKDESGAPFVEEIYWTIHRIPGTR